MNSFGSSEKPGDHFYTITVPTRNIGQRIDIFLSEHEDLRFISRTAIQILIRSGNISVNEKKIKTGYKLKDNDTIFVSLPSPSPSTLEPENLPLHILHEDDAIIVLNKPPNLVVHPSCGHNSGTLVHGLLYHCKDLSNMTGEQRPGIVHRLDKDTSGVMVVAKNDIVHRLLTKEFKQRNVKKIYHAIVRGHLTEAQGCIDLPIGRNPIHRKKMAVFEKGGRKAVTKWHVKENFKPPFTFVELLLETGRTHQIRVHMAAKGHPVAGDSLYGKSDQQLNKQYRIRRQCLHSSVLAFNHPKSGEYVQFEAPLWQDMIDVLTALREGT